MMSATETATDENEVVIANLTPRRLAAGAVGGFIGSLAFAAIMFTMNRGVMEAAIPAMYGSDPSIGVGFALHQWHGVFLGLLYVVGVENIGAFRDASRTVKGSVGLGVGYGFLTTLLPVLVMPLWLSGVGFEMAPPFPNAGMPQTVMQTLNHVVYAFPLALLYHLVVRE